MTKMGGIGWRLPVSGFCGTAINEATRFDIAQERNGIGSSGNNDFGFGNWDPILCPTWLLHDKFSFTSMI